MEAKKGFVGAKRHGLGGRQKQQQPQISVEWPPGFYLREELAGGSSSQPLSRLMVDLAHRNEDFSEAKEP